MLKKLTLGYLKLMLLWILIFDFQRLLFLIHNWNKFEKVNFSEWILAFFYSLKLDIATTSGLIILPFLFYALFLLSKKRVFKILFQAILVLEFLLVAMIHCGEINAYGEWNHKLTSRVFMHLANPDEVFRTADYGMTFWYFVYLIIEFVFSIKLGNRLFSKSFMIESTKNSIYKNILRFFTVLIIISGTTIVLLRGGFQQIPININAAIYSNNSVANDLSINPLYFFAKSFLLYNRSEIDEFMPKIDAKLAEKIVSDLMEYPEKHENYFLELKKPNIVLVIMESWAAEAIGCMSKTKGATPNFDNLASEGLLFTNVYGTSHTSEIGNASIFSGFPGVPEVSISMQPEKSRKLKSINQSLAPLGYTSSYLFGGDLKYGNIGGFFLDHGFEVVKDENDFNSSLKRGKLNYFDEDLYTKFISEINSSNEPFLHCAFTGSTHSPFDVPKTKNQKWTGNEADYMNSLVYADQSLKKFIQKAKKQKWYKNTLFIFVSDHSHSTPEVGSPNDHLFYRIPLLFWGPVLKTEYKGNRIDRLGSQVDIPATLMYQMNLSKEGYPWSRDLMNPAIKPFAFHTIIRGYGWVRNTGFLTYQMQMKQYLEDNFDKQNQAIERQNCNAFLNQIYHYYKDL
jgi:phosphoglycerol transferase MdoB-like AlkP superfamily enzyme